MRFLESTTRAPPPLRPVRANPPPGCTGTGDRHRPTHQSPPSRPAHDQQPSRTGHHDGLTPDLPCPFQDERPQLTGRHRGLPHHLMPPCPVRARVSPGALVNGLTHDSPSECHVGVHAQLNSRRIGHRDMPSREPPPPCPAHDQQPPSTGHRRGSTRNPAPPGPVHDERPPPTGHGCGPPRDSIRTRPVRVRRSLGTLADGTSLRAYPRFATTMSRSW